MKKVLLLIVSILLLCGCNEKATVTMVQCDEANKLVDDGAILIDVRNVTEFDEYHLDNAINIEYDVIGNKIGSVTQDKNAKIIVYCKSGNRSGKAAQTLIDKGYKNVYDLGGYGKCVS